MRRYWLVPGFIRFNGVETSTRSFPAALSGEIFECTDLVPVGESDKVGIQLARAELKQRIIMRTEKMVAAGFLDEVKSILDRGYSYNLKPLQSLGYKQIIGFLRKEYDWENALDLINRDTWYYAKRQLTWFVADKEINWFKPDLSGEIKKNVKKFWKDCTPA